ncbi:MAG: hypothetical protein MJZ36_07540 [Bacteroidaceae bacterium]|nr:hypothetical protein [Bacteroidaceae bacterium]
MKKLMFIAAAGLIALSASAQDKEALKLEKKAIKEAEQLVKKAQSTFDGCIANPQMGRKETNFEKLDGARDLIDQALGNKYLTDNVQLYKVAADIYNQYYSKLEKEVAADESKQPEFLGTAQKVATYCMKYDSLYNLDPKKKEPEYKTAHTLYQTIGINPILKLLMAAQTKSNSDDQAEIKSAAGYADVVVNALTKSGLFKDFTHDNKAEWIDYAKVFKAQSLVNVEGADPAKVEDAYMQLKGTKYEATAYQALANFYKEKDKNKFVEYLKLGMEKGGDEAYPTFAFQLMMYQFQNELKDDCLKTIQDIKVKCPDNDNTVRAYLMEGQIYFEKKDFEKAEKLFREAVEKFPDEEQAIPMPARSAWMKAQTTQDKKDMQHAIDLFKELQEKYPDNSDFWGEPLYILYNNVSNFKERDKYKKYYNVK